MNEKSICFWTGVNAAMLYANVGYYFVNGSGWSLAAACFAAVGVWLGHDVVLSTKGRE